MAKSPTKRSGPGSYPWDHCMDDQRKRYPKLSEKRRRAICGAIKAHSMKRHPGYWKARGAKKNPAAMPPLTDWDFNAGSGEIVPHFILSGTHGTYHFIADTGRLQFVDQQGRFHVLRKRISVEDVPGAVEAHVETGKLPGLVRSTARRAMGRDVYTGRARPVTKRSVRGKSMATNNPSMKHLRGKMPKGWVIKRIDDEYAVHERGAPEAQWYYTDDWQDAVRTAYAEYELSRNVRDEAKEKAQYVLDGHRSPDVEVRERAKQAAQSVRRAKQFYGALGEGRDASPGDKRRGIARAEREVVVWKEATKMVDDALARARSDGLPPTVNPGARRNPGAKRNPARQGKAHHRRDIILPGDLAGRVLEWHGGMGTSAYSLGSTGLNDYVSTAMVEDALWELARDLGPRSKLTKADKRELGEVVEELDIIVHDPEEYTTKAAGLGDVDSGYSTWLMDEEDNPAPKSNLVRMAQVKRDNGIMSLRLSKSWQDPNEKLTSIMDAFAHSIAGYHLADQVNNVRVRRQAYKTAKKARAEVFKLAKLGKEEYVADRADAGLAEAVGAPVRNPSKKQHAAFGKKAIASAQRHLKGAMGPGGQAMKMQYALNAFAEAVRAYWNAVDAKDDKMAGKAMELAGNARNIVRSSAGLKPVAFIYGSTPFRAKRVTKKPRKSKKNPGGKPKAKGNPRAKAALRQALKI